METSLKSSLCSVQDLGATGNMDIREKNLQIISFEQIKRINYINQCQQQLCPGAIIIYKPAILVILNRQVLHLQTGWISDKYFQTHIS